MKWWLLLLAGLALVGVCAISHATNTCPELVLHRVWLSSSRVSSGETVSVFFEISNNGLEDADVTLGASFRRNDGEESLSDTSGEETVTIASSRKLLFFRDFTIPENAHAGIYNIEATVYSRVPCALYQLEVPGALTVEHRILYPIVPLFTDTSITQAPTELQAPPREMGSIVLPLELYPDGEGERLPVFVPSSDTSSVGAAEDSTNWEPVESMDEKNLYFDYHEAIAGFTPEEADTSSGAFMSFVAELLNAVGDGLGSVDLRFIVEEKRDGSRRLVIELHDVAGETWVRRLAGSATVASQFEYPDLVIPDVVMAQFREGDYGSRGALWVQSDAAHATDSCIGYLSFNEAGRLEFTPKVYPEDEFQFRVWRVFRGGWLVEDSLPLSRIGNLWNEVPPYDQSKILQTLLVPTGLRVVSEETVAGVVVRELEWLDSSDLELGFILQRNSIETAFPSVAGQPLGFQTIAETGPDITSFFDGHPESEVALAYRIAAKLPDGGRSNWHTLPVTDVPKEQDHAVLGSMSSPPVEETDTDEATRGIERIRISGRSELSENTSAQFQCKANSSDGSFHDLTAVASWSVTPTGYVTIDAGVLTVGNINADRTVEIIAEYSDGETIWTDRMAVTLRNTPRNTSPSEILLDVYVCDGSVNGYPPIEGATVFGQDGSGREFTAVTDSTGHAQVYGGIGRWYYDVTADGYYRGEWNGNRLYEEDTDRQMALQPIPGRKTVDVYVYEDDSLSELVTSGAQVHIETLEGETFDLSTNAQGFVRVTAAQGPWDITISKDEYEPTLLKEMITANTERIDGYLGGVDRTFVARIHIHENDLDGSPVAGARVWGHDQNGNEFEGTTNSSGVVELVGEEGQWNLDASAHGFEPSSWGFQIRSWTDPEIHHSLEKHITYVSRTIWLDVVPLQPGTAIPNAAIRFIGGDGEEETYTLDVHSREFISLNAVPGDWEVTVSIHGYHTTTWQQEILEDQGPRDYTIRIHPIGWPEIPTGVTATTYRCNDVTVSWNSMPNADSYDIYRSLSPSGEFDLLEVTSSTSIEDRDVLPDTDYYYHISSRSSEGNRSDVSETVMGHRTRPNGAPTGVSASDDEDYQVTVCWEGVAGAYEYLIQRAPSPDGVYTDLSRTPETCFVALEAVPQTTHYYRVMSSNGCGWGEPSESDAGTATGLMLVSPTNVRASEGEFCDKIVVSWDAVPGATSYHVSRSLADAYTPTWNGFVTATSIEDTEAELGFKYDYRVRASDSDGARYGGFSAWTSGSRARAPVSSSQDIGTATHCGSVLVSWPAVEGATRYEVYRTMDHANVPYSKIGSTVFASYDDTTALPAQAYYYKVSPCNDCGCGPLFGGRFGRADGPLPPPTLVSASQNLCDSIRVSWQGVPGATNYQVFRSNTQDGDYTLRANIHSGQDRSYSEYVGSSFGGPADANTYYYRVAAECGPCGVGDLSQPAAGASAYIPEAPAGVVASDGEHVNRIRIAWESVDGAVVYEIWRHWSGYDYRRVGESNDAFWDDTNVMNSTYYYKVKACGAGPDGSRCCSELSEEDSGTAVYEP